jgi:hypothetical protein
VPKLPIPDIVFDCVSLPGGYDLRTVEKAYWKRYTVENDVGNW